MSKVSDTFLGVDLSRVSAAVRSGVRESVVEKGLIRVAARVCPLVEVKKIDATVPGWRRWPDRIVFVPGVRVPVHFVETKRPKGGKFEPGQLEHHTVLRQNFGLPVFVVLDSEGLDQYAHVLGLILKGLTSSAAVQLSTDLSNKCINRFTLMTRQRPYAGAGARRAKTG